MNAMIITSLVLDLQANTSLLTPLFSFFDNTSLATIPFLGSCSRSAYGKAYVDQVTTGLMLSDATLVKKYKGGGTYFQIAQSIIYLPFINHIHSLMFALDYCHMLAPTLKTAKVKGLKYLYASFNTKSFTEWNELHALWYVNGIKVVPATIEALLTPVALAYWHMGDGGWTGNGIHLATNSFSSQDVLRLVNVLQTKYGISCTVHSGNRIYIWAKSVPDFVALIRPHIHEVMMYKVDKNYPKPVKQVPVPV